MLSLRVNSESGTVEPYENNTELIELLGNFLLPSGRTCDLRILFDLGASNNFINRKLVHKYKIRVQDRENVSVLMGGSRTIQAEGETGPLTMKNGTYRHTSTYTAMDLGVYDVVLGMPFFNNNNVRVTASETGQKVQIGTKRGPMTLPVKANREDGPRVYHMATYSDFRRQLSDKDEIFQLIPNNRNGPPVWKEPKSGTTPSFEWVAPEQPPGGPVPADPETLGAQDDPSEESRVGDYSEGRSQDPQNRPLPGEGPSQDPIVEGIAAKKESVKDPYDFVPVRLTELRLSDQKRDPDAENGGRDPKLGIHPSGDAPGRDPKNPWAPEGDPLDKIPRAKDHPELEELLEKFRDVFPADLPLNLPPEREIFMRIPVKEGSDPPCQAPYRLHEDAKQTVEETIRYLMDHGLVRESLSEYGAPITLAKKPDGTWRFCTDYRRLNSITKEAKYPIPRIEDCLDKLRGAKYFSKLDLRSGYWQVRIHPEDVEKSAFRTHLGHYEWMVVPFGLQGAPSCFQRLMNHYLRPYLGKFCIVYIDDILIYSRTKEEHLQHLELILQILREKELYAKGSKCDLMRTQVSFLGYIVKHSTIMTDPSKIEAVQNWEPPTTVRELRSFLGLCNFYRKFVKDYAKIAKPLTNLTSSTEFEAKFGRKFTKTASLELGDKEKPAFETLKKALTEAPCLVIYDPTKPTEVWADASWENGAVGAALMQDHGNGWQPVAFMSKVMNKAQRDYATFEQELLALKLAFDEWKHYLLPLQFVARTDHNGLKYLKTQKTLNQRQWHWLAFFSEFQFELFYRPGAKMQVPDALSRKPHTQDDLKDLLRICDADNKNDVEIRIPTSKGITTVCLTLKSQMNKKVQQKDLDLSSWEYKDDKDFGEIFKVLTEISTKPSKNIDKPPSFQLYDLRDNKLWWLDRTQNDRICVPLQYRIQVIREFHDTPVAGHLGIDKTYHSIRRYFYWPNMKRTIEDYVSTCDSCQKHKVWTQKRYRDPKIPMPSTEPWATVSIDFCGPFPKTHRGNDFVMAVTCTLIKESLFCPCKTTITSSGTAKLYVDQVFRYKGCPQKIISDRGPQFVAKFWQTLWKLLGTTSALTASYHPQANPIERDNRTFEDGLKSFVNARQDDWDDRLILFEFAFNNTVNPSTGQTPFYLGQGRHPRLPSIKDIKCDLPAVEDFVTNLQNEISAARDNILKSKAYNADFQDPKFQKPNFKVGDQVLLDTTNLNLQLPSRKLVPRFIGPLRILQLRGENSVILEVPPRLQRLDPLQNVQWLKPYKSRPSALGPQTIQPLPAIHVDGQPEFEVEDIIAHRKVGKTYQYLTRFKGYTAEADEWLPATNLENAPRVLARYHKRNNLPK